MWTNLENFATPSLVDFGGHLVFAHIGNLKMQQTLRLVNELV